MRIQPKKLRLIEYFSSIGLVASNADSIKCYECRGSGRVRDVKDLDPVEGYKLADWYQCQTCTGSGTINITQARSYYDSEYLTKQYEPNNKKFQIYRMLRMMIRGNSIAVSIFKYLDSDRLVDKLYYNMNKHKLPFTELEKNLKYLLLNVDLE